MQQIFLTTRLTLHVMFVWQTMTGGDRLSDLGWEVRSAGGRWFLSTSELHAAKRVMTWSYRGIFIFFYYIPVCTCSGIFFNPQCNTNGQWCLEVWITNAFNLLGQMEKMIMWNLDSGKDNCSRYNVLPDLALSSSFISYTLHWPLPLLHAEWESPLPICQTFQWAPSVSCQHRDTGLAPYKNPQGQWLYFPALLFSLKTTHDVTLGQQGTLAKQVLRQGGCWVYRLSSAVLSQGSSTCSMFTSAHFWAQAHTSALLCGQPRLGVHYLWGCSSTTCFPLSPQDNFQFTHWCRKKPQQNQGCYTTPVAPLLSCGGGLFLWSWLFLFF